MIKSTRMGKQKIRLHDDYIRQIPINIKANQSMNDFELSFQLNLPDTFGSKKAIFPSSPKRDYREKRLRRRKFVSLFEVVFVYF